MRGRDYIAKVPYLSIVSHLMYAMVYTKPHVMGVANRYMANPRIKHWEAKWLLRYLIGTSNMTLCFMKNNETL